MQPTKLDKERNKLSEIKDETKLMRLNHVLANNKLLKIICASIDGVAILFFNYAFSVIFQVGKALKSHGDYQMSFNIVQMFYFKAPWWLYLLIIVFLIGLNVRIVYNMKTSFGDFNINQKGSARWTTIEEIKEQYKAIPEKSIPFSGNGGMLISWEGNTKYIDDSGCNNLIIGITRSGKGEMIVFPTIDIYSRAEKKASMIITDPKLELAPASYDTLIKRGYEVHILNLIDPLDSMGYNPLQLVIDAYKKGEFADADLLCSSFCYSIFNPDEADGDSQFWANNSTFLLSALILAHTEDCLNLDNEINMKRKHKWKKNQERYLALSNQDKEEIDIAANEYKILKEAIKQQSGIEKIKTKRKIDEIECKIELYNYGGQAFVPTTENEKKINMYSILNLFQSLTRIKDADDDSVSALDAYFNHRPDLNPAKAKYGAIEVAGGKTKGSIYSNTLAKLTVFMGEKITKMTMESSVDLEQVGFGDKPIAIFMGIPDYDRSNHFIASVFIRQLYFVLAKKCNIVPSGKCSREVVFLLDEFGNLPAIENMAHIATVCLGRNIRFNLIIQSYAQIQKLYGDDAETIIGNCSNQIYIMTNDNNTAEQFSKSIGNETITNINRVGGKLSMEKSFTEMTEEKPLLNPNELMELTQGQCVVKRTMKRTDLKGNDIKPRSIFNHNETKFKYRYEYMLDDFPSGKTVQQVNKENRYHIKKEERVYDYNEFFRKIEEESTPEAKEQKEIDRIKRKVYENYRFDIRNKEMESYTSVIKDIYEYIQENPYMLLGKKELDVTMEEMKELTVEEAYDLISECNCDQVENLFDEGIYEMDNPCISNSMIQDETQDDTHDKEKNELEIYIRDIPNKAYDLIHTYLSDDDFMSVNVFSEEDVFNMTLNQVIDMMQDKDITEGIINSIIGICKGATE